jgi:hypothetical protein
MADWPPGSAPGGLNYYILFVVGIDWSSELHGDLRVLRQNGLLIIGLAVENTIRLGVVV